MRSTPATCAGIGRHEHRGRVVGEAAGHVEPGGRQRHDLLADDLALRERRAPRRDRLALVVGADVGGGRLERAAQRRAKAPPAGRAARRPGRRSPRGAPPGRAARSARARRRRRERARRPRWPRPPSAPRRPAARAPGAPRPSRPRRRSTAAVSSSPPARRASWPRSAPTSSRSSTLAARAATRCALPAATTSPTSSGGIPASPASAGSEARPRRRRGRARAPGLVRRARGCRAARPRRRSAGSWSPDTASRSRSRRSGLPPPGTIASTSSSRQRAEVEQVGDAEASLEEPVAADHADVQGAAVAGAQDVAGAAEQPGAGRMLQQRRRPLLAQRGDRQTGCLEQVEDLGLRPAGLAGEADPHLAPNASAISRAPPLSSRPSARRRV